MTYQQIVLFSLLAAIMVLMFWGRWRHDIVAFAGLMAAVILGVVPQEMAFSGFGNPTTLIVALVLVATAGLTRSGAVSRLTRLLSARDRGVTAHIALFGGVGGFLSGFMNNIAALAMLMPIDMQAARKSGRAAGMTLMPQETFDVVVAQAADAGIQVGTHGNGDRAIDSILDAYEAGLAAHPGLDHRFRIEHCQAVREDQLDRMAKMGVLASFFNLHVYYWGARHRDRFLGPERGPRISPLRLAKDRGIVFGCHSDWWVTPVDPLMNMQVAVTRQTREGESLGPELTLTPEEALRSMTIDSAYLGFEETTKGSIEVGKLGDLVLLSDDPLTVAADQIESIEVDATVVGGELVYDRGRDGGVASRDLQGGGGNQSREQKQEQGTTEQQGRQQSF
ncbi:MAG: SLC13 family permease, partial [Paracoccus sp. (in: a-proteobacteria)]